MSSSAAPSGTLYLVPNLLGLVPPGDVLPQRTIDIARRLEHFVVETPKAARQFISMLQPARALRAMSFVALDARMSSSRLTELLAPAFAGKDIGMLSDAGCPGVADPGAELVAQAHRRGVRVVPLVGPSAILLALMASGMNGQHFTFHGYLAVKPEARTQQIRALDQAIARTGATQIFIETPYRNEAIVAATLAACRPSTLFCVAFDLTLPTEQVISRTIADWRASARPIVGKRPAMFLLGGA